MSVTELRTEPVFDALKQPLALVESDERRLAIETYIEAARVPLERAVHDLMSQMAVAVDAQVESHYRVRLAYRPDGLALEIDEKPQNGNGEADAFAAATLEGDVEKITIRIPAEMKDLATQAAARAGTSANTWFIKALSRSLRNMDAQGGPPPAPEPPPQWGGRHRKHGSTGGRFSGWVGGEDQDQ